MSKRQRKLERPQLTSRGRGLLIVTVILILAGVMTGGSVLVQLGILCAGVLLVARIWNARNVKRLRVTRVLPAEVFSGQDFDYEFEVSNRRRQLPARDLIVSDKLLPFHERGVAVEALRARGRIRERFGTRMIGRGKVGGIGYRVESAFPLGLFNSTLRRRGSESVLIYPKPVLPAALRASAFDSSHDDAGAAAELHESGELRGVREFQQGDPLNRVMWPVFARSGRLTVREFDRPLPEKYTLIFHSYCPPGKLIWPETFEHAIGLLAGLLFMGRDQHVPMEIIAPFTQWQPVQIRDSQRLGEPLEMLALAPHAPAGNLSEVSSVLANLPGRHPVFVVSEAPVRHWADELPPVGRVVTCLDTTTLKVKRPALAGFRRAPAA